MKDQMISIMELIDDGYTPRQVSTFLGITIDEVIKTMEKMGYLYPDESDYERGEYES
jgi:hypothetical protein